MAGTQHSLDIRKRVLALGAKGKTYTEIREQYPIPKSTLSFWFKNAGRKPDRSRQLEHMKLARERALITIHRNKQERLKHAEDRARLNLGTLSLTDMSTLKALLAMLYWAEGSKSDIGSMVFANTDPLLASLYLRLLRTTFPLDESKLRVRLHLHHYHGHAAARTFWSELLEVPESQFGKIYVKKRSVRKRFRRNFQDICFIVYHDASVRREVLALGRLLGEKFCNAPVAQWIECFPAKEEVAGSTPAGRTR